MSKSKSYQHRRVRVRDIETGKLLSAIWRESTVTTQSWEGRHSGKGASQAWLEDGGDPLNPTDDPKRFKALLSGRTVEVVDEN